MDGRGIIFSFSRTAAGDVFTDEKEGNDSFEQQLLSKIGQYPEWNVLGERVTSILNSIQELKGWALAGQDVPAKYTSSLFIRLKPKAMHKGCVVILYGKWMDAMPPLTDIPETYHWPHEGTSFYCMNVNSDGELYVQYGSKKSGMCQIIGTLDDVITALSLPSPGDNSNSC